GRGRRATSDHRSGRLPVTVGQMPMTEGASLRSRVPQKWHARFWSRGGGSDPSIDCSRVNLTIRQHVAAVGRRVMMLCKGAEGLRQQLALYHVYYNFCLPHASVRVPLLQPEPTNGTGSTKRWRPRTPAMAAGLTDH